MAERRPVDRPVSTPAEGELAPPPGRDEGGRPTAVPSVEPEEVFDPAAAEAYHQRARLAEDRLAEVLAAYRQLRLENEDHRERVSRNLERRYQGQHDALLLRFMDILDNLDRALDAVQTSYADDSLVEGLILVRNQLLQTLQDEGLERIPVVGLPYDPHLSEAVGTEPVEDPEQHHLVVRELLRGYRLNGRVARASRVVIGEYRDRQPEADEPDTASASAAGVAARAAAVTAADLEAATDAAKEDSLEDIIARVEAREGRSEAEPPMPTPTGEDSEEEDGKV